MLQINYSPSLLICGPGFVGRMRVNPFRPPGRIHKQAAASILKSDFRVLGELPLANRRTYLNKMYQLERRFA